MTYLQHSKTSIPRVTIQNAIFGDRTLTSFADTSLLMGKKKVSPIVGWYKALYQLDYWAVFCTMFLSNKEKHPATFDIFLLFK